MCSYIFPVTVPRIGHRLNLAASCIPTLKVYTCNCMATCIIQVIYQHLQLYYSYISNQLSPSTPGLSVVSVAHRACISRNIKDHDCMRGWVREESLLNEAIYNYTCMTLLYESIAHFSSSTCMPRSMYSKVVTIIIALEQTGFANFHLLKII